MKYTDKKAIELQKKYNLSPATMATWKHRGKIPDMYQDGTLPVKITNLAEKEQLQNLLRALQSGKFNITVLSELSGVRHSRIKDFTRNKGILYQKDLIALKKAVNGLRINVKKSLDDLSLRRKALDQLKTLIFRREIVWFVVLNRDRQLWNQINNWKWDKGPFPEDGIPKVKSCLLVFLTETVI